jgi:hypothetical protein
MAEFHFVEEGVKMTQGLQIETKSKTQKGNLGEAKERSKPKTSKLLESDLR